MQKTIKTQKDVILALLSTGMNIPTRVLKRLGLSYTQRIAELRREFNLAFDTDNINYTIFTNKTDDGDCYRLWKHEKPVSSKCVKGKCSSCRCKR